MNLQTGSIVRCVYEGKRLYGLVESAPRKKTTDVRVILDPGRKGVYRLIPLPRSVLTLAVESADTQAARLRIKAVRLSQEGHAVSSRRKHDPVMPSSSPGSPVRSDEPIILCQGSSSYWAPGLERHLCGSRADWVRARLKERYPQYYNIIYLREVIGLAMPAVAKRLDIGIWNAYKRLERAQSKKAELRVEWNDLDDDDKVA